MPTDSEDAPRLGNLLVVMGVSGSGKSTVGEALAVRLEVPFKDGDALHPPENVEKMARGEALDDKDRGPWLDAVAAWLAAHAKGGGVIACSALKRSYRDRLRSPAPDLAFVHLVGDPELIGQRQGRREGHYMPGSLMASQLAALEPLAPDEQGMGVDVSLDVAAIVDAVASRVDDH